MPRYAITEKAGRFVAGQSNTGVGSILTLSERQAAHELRLGSLRPLDIPAPEVEAEETPAPKRSRGRTAAAKDED